MAKQEHVSKEMSELPYSEQQSTQSWSKIQQKWNLTDPGSSQKSWVPLSVFAWSTHPPENYFAYLDQQGSFLLISQCSTSSTKLVSGFCPELCLRGPDSCQWRTKKLMYIGKKEMSTFPYCLCFCFCASFRDNQGKPCRLQRALEICEVWLWGIGLAPDVHFSGTPKFNPSPCLYKMIK